MWTTKLDGSEANEDLKLPIQRKLLSQWGASDDKRSLEPAKPADEMTPSFLWRESKPTKAHYSEALEATNFRSITTGTSTGAHAGGDARSAAQNFLGAFGGDEVDTTVDEGILTRQQLLPQ